MTDKSHVSMEQRVCLVCGQRFDTGSILLDQRVRPVLDPTTVTGWGLCEEHEKLHKDGFVALVACDHAKSVKEPDGSIKPAGAHRTGLIAHLARKAAKAILTGVNLTDAKGREHAVLFCDEEVITKLQQMTKQQEG